MDVVSLDQRSGNRPSELVPCLTVVSPLEQLYSVKLLDDWDWTLSPVLLSPWQT